MTDNINAGISALLRRIIADTLEEIASDKRRQSFKRLKQMIKDAPPLQSFSNALSAGPAIIAEIKERSPSQGKMRHQNVKDAPFEYKKSDLVKAISVLTNRTHFGMRVERLADVKEQTGKPVLRKDFILDEYQIYQARAYGADAILLMANVLTPETLHRFSCLASELHMDVLFETHSAEELQALPQEASIIGINCRNFDAHGLKMNNFVFARILRQWLGAEHDRSVSIDRFEYASSLPNHVIKVAESGVTPKNCADVFSKGFDAILVGTSFLMDTRGVAASLADFEKAIDVRAITNQHRNSRTSGNKRRDWKVPQPDVSKVCSTA